MDRTTSLLRRTYVFGAIALATMALVVLRPSTTSESLSSERLAPTFPGFEPAKARVLEVDRKLLRDGKETKEAVRLVRNATGGWVLESAWAFPADGKRVDDFLKSLTGVRTQSTPTTNPEKFASFASADGYTDVRVLGDGDAPILSFGLGKGGAEGSWRNVFLRVDDVAKGALASAPAGPDAKPAAGKVVAAEGLDSYGNRTESTYWAETRLWPGLSETEIQEISILQGPPARTVTLARVPKVEKPKDDKPDDAAMDAGDAKEAALEWKMTSPTEEKANADSANQATRAFAGMLFTSIVDGLPATAESDVKYGFDKPDLVITAKGAKSPKAGEATPIWVLTVGKKDDAKSTWYVRRTSGASRETWTFTVNDADLTHFRDEPDRYRDKKAEPPAPATPAAPGVGPAMEEPPAMGETPAMGEAPAMEEPPAMGEPPAPPGATPEPAMGEAPAMGGEPPAPSPGPAPAGMGEAAPIPPAPAGMGEAPPPK